jgi:hypothetical protein
MTARLLCWLTVILHTGSASAADQPWETMPEGEGRMETFAVCSACHSIMLVQQQGMDRGRWDDTMVWMVEEQGMPALEPELREKVLDYLVMAYPPARPNYQQPGQ